MTLHYISSQPRAAAATLPGTGFLPDLCTAASLIRILTVTAFCSLLITLVGSELIPFDWRQMGLVSLFMLWVTLSAALLLCRLRGWLQTRSAALQAAVSFLVVISMTAALAIVTELLRLQGLLYLPRAAGRIDWIWVATCVAISMLICGVAVHYLYLQYLANRERQLALEARLQALQARIRPHFLFNSMNVIAELIPADPALAEEAVLDLCDLFRDALSREPGLVPLREEITLVERYLRLEQLRLKEQLSLDWQIDPACLDRVVPSLSLQPLVENAIYHGIAQLGQPGTLSVHARLEEGTLCLQVHNPLPPQQAPGAGHHLALNNLRERLAACFGDDGVLHCARVGDAYHAEIRIRGQ